MRRITFAAAALLALALPAAAAPIQVTDARIAAGRMIIVGKSTPGAKVGIVGTNFLATVNSKGYFRFAPAWRPASCKVTLKSGTTQVGAVIALCGPQGAPGPSGPAGNGDPPPTDSATTKYYDKEIDIPGTPAGQFEPSRLWATQQMARRSPVPLLLGKRYSSNIPELCNIRSHLCSL